MRNHYTSAFLLSCGMAILALQANAQTWDGTSEQWTKGDGTANNPFIIENEAQFAHFAESVNGGEDFKGKTFRIARNLDFTGHTFPVIGKLDKYLSSETMDYIDESVYFLGTLDGDNHTLNGLSIDYFNEELGGTGLFACTAEGTVVKNLILGKSSKIEGGIVTGAFVGLMNGGTIENCLNQATVNAREYSGGIAGSVEAGSIIRCANTGSVTGTTEIGGIIGQGSGTATVTDCFNTAPVTATGFGGGGIGGALYNSFAIKNCYSTGKIVGESSQYFGSPHAVVSDAAFNSTVTDCYYVAALSGVDDEKAKAISEEEIKSDAFVETLNAKASSADAFAKDEKGSNGGFPILTWMKSIVAGIHSATAPSGDANITVDGRNLSSETTMQAYDLAGRLIATGKELHLDAGTYIVKAGTKSVKISIAE